MEDKTSSSLSLSSLTMTLPTSLSSSITVSLPSEHASFSVSQSASRSLSPSSTPHHKVSSLSSSTTTTSSSSSLTSSTDKRLYYLESNYGFEDKKDRNEKSIKEEKLWRAKYKNSLSNQEKEWNKNGKTQNKIKKLCRIGIPIFQRPTVWFKASGADRLLSQNIGYYDKMLLLNDKESPSIRDIDRDIDRTFTNHPFFREGNGRLSLRRVLVAFSHRRHDIGYCQSMNFVCGLLLLFFSEEHAFWMFVNIIEKILPPDYYSSSMKGAQIDCGVFKVLLKKKNIKVWKHLEKFNLDPSIVVVPWFVCLFSHSSLPIESVIRVWDSLFMEGNKVLFRVALAIFHLNSKLILKCTEMGDLIRHVSSMSSDLFDSDLLLKTCFYEIGSLSKTLLSKERSNCKKVVEKELADIERARASSN